MYILGAVYAVVGYAQVLLGHYQSIVDFSAAQLEPGTFYSLGRFVMSFLLMAATLLIAKLIYRETKQLALAGAYVILLGFFPFIVKYSNYIRADTFVTFSAFWRSTGLFLQGIMRTFESQLLLVPL